MLWFVRCAYGVRSAYACASACVCGGTSVECVSISVGACVCQHTCTSPSISSITDMTTTLETGSWVVASLLEKLVRSTSTFLLLCKLIVRARAVPNLFNHAGSIRGCVLDTATLDDSDAILLGYPMLRAHVQYSITLCHESIL